MSQTTAPRETACVGKFVYRSAFSAHRGVNVMVRRRKFKREKGEFLMPYRCAHCGLWHIGGSAV